MDVSIKNTDALNAVLTVKISNDDYKDTYNSSLKKPEILLFSNSSVL